MPWIWSGSARRERTLGCVTGTYIRLEGGAELREKNRRYFFRAATRAMVRVSRTDPGAL